MENVKIKINGREIEAAADATILEVTRARGLDDIPTLCHSDELEPYGSCFLCAVEVKGRPSLVPACATRVSPGMEVTTRNDRIVESRRTALELLLSNHYADCVPPCSEGCPGHLDIQGYLALSAMGLYKEAIELIRERNPLPAICGRICVRKCEDVCRRADIDAPVGINWVKRFLSDLPGAYDGAPVCDPPTGKKVAIVGAGPAGLTAAWFLARRGHQPVIYEAQSRPGGMLSYGIPAYRLPDDVVDREVDYICRAGVEIRYNTRVGKDVSLDDLMKGYDAVFLCPGAWAGNPMRLPGEFETEGVVQGAEFLPELRKTPAPLKGTVAVVGGGNTAMDVARTTWRLGADKVVILYRRTKDEMPADRMEIADCIAEGIEIMELVAPVGIISDNGKLKGLRCQRMKLGEPDSSGRRRPVPLEGSEFDFLCDMAVSAIGQAALLEGLTEAASTVVGLTKWNTFVIDPKSLSTNVRGVFAGGDAADDGPTVVIDAIADGQEAAHSIDCFLSGKEVGPRPFFVQKDFWEKPGEAEQGKIEKRPRREVRHIDIESRRGSFAEVATGFEREDAVHECGRCLSCGCLRFDDCRLRLYAEEYGVDMDRFKGQVRKHKVDDRHPHIVYDPNKCILCARCIRTCARVLPVAALGLVDRGFRAEARPAMNDPLADTNCVSCGNCIDACPTGALTGKHPFLGRANLSTDDQSTHCAFCSLACRITVKRFGPGRQYVASSGAPGDYLCRYGRFGHELFVRCGRITSPEIRCGRWNREAGLTEAVEAAVNGLKKAVAKHGAEKVGVFVSPELTNEELYLAARIAREGVGTNNIVSLSILGVGAPAGALDEMLGFTASTADCSVVDEADLIICNNTSMESDQFVLAARVIQAVRAGAKLIVSNSVPGPADRLFSAVALDPMRGRASVMWNGILQLMIGNKVFDLPNIEKIAGGARFPEGGDFEIGKAAAFSGVDVAAMREAAEILGQAKRVVIIHSPDRAQDQADGDLRELGNLVALLRAAGVKADILLLRMYSNGAALEVVGAAPSFGPGRVPPSLEIAGARTKEELLAFLESGGLRGALVIGEDPLAWESSGSWFGNVEFLAAMDWADTETTRNADVVLPGATYLETAGTRCNFEGALIRYSQVAEPPAGVTGDAVLKELARSFGLAVPDDTVAELDAVVRKKLGGLARFYWNTGEARYARMKLRPDFTVGGGVRTSWISPSLTQTEKCERGTGLIPLPLTQAEKYKREIRETGTGRYRAGS
ncbi:MAG: FAD-dependent oxidoreductase [Syntrophorhabdaceae bacterium]|nr:FAD-dependent oxidoreductase [Syntrophorhabdaceae bacterium]